MQFRLGSIPIRVRAPFFLMVLLLGGTLTDADGQHDARLLPIWGIIVFVSVLVHELGHALVGRRFGLTPQIDLHGMGGTTSWTAGHDVGHARNIAISFAGPFAGFVLGALAYAVKASIPPAQLSPLTAETFRLIRWVNIGWGIVNLAPMLPLDGGNIMRSFLQIVTRGRGEKPARFVSIGIAGLLVLFALSTHWLWMGMLGALFIFSNVQALRGSGQRTADATLGAAIEQAYRALDAHDGAGAIGILRSGLNPHASPELRQIALRLFAYSLLIEGHWGELLPLLESERLLIGDAELTRYATTARELGRAEDAARIDALIASLRPRMANDFGT